MTEVKFLRFFVPFVKRKVDNPGVGDFVRVFKIEVVGKTDAELTEDFVDFGSGVGAEEDGIAGLGAGLCLYGFDF